MENNTKGAIIHISALFTWIFGPIIVYLLSDDDFIKQNAIKALNWQITFAIYIIISFILSIVVIGILTGFIALIANIVFIIKAAISAKNGEIWSYRWTYSFI